MKLIYSESNNCDDIALDVNDIPEYIFSTGHFPEIIVSSGADSALFPLIIKFGRYADLFRGIKTVHEIESGEESVSFCFCNYDSEYYRDELNNIRFGNCIYPTASALIYCDRIIIKDRSIYTDCGPVIPHYLRQFGFKIYEYPEIDQTNRVKICRELFRCR